MFLTLLSDYFDIFCEQIKLFSCFDIFLSNFEAPLNVENFWWQNGPKI